MNEKNAEQAAQKDWDAAVSAANLAPATGHVVLNAAAVLNIAALLSKLRAPVADERAVIAEATGHVTEALIYVDRVAQSKAIGYADFGTNPRRNHNDTRPYNLKDARHDAYTAAILLRKAWDILEPSISFKAATALASAPVDPEATEVDFLVRVFENLDTWRAEDWNELLERRPAILALLRPLVLASAPVVRPWPVEEQPDGTVTPVDPVDMASAPVAGEAQPVAWMAKPVVSSGSTAVFCSDRRLADQWDYGGHPEYGRMILTPLYAAPQASTVAEDVRNAALEEAAMIVETAPDYLQDSSFNGAARAIRALKQPHADKDGCTCPSGDGSLRHPCPMHPGADKDGGQQRAGENCKHARAYRAGDRQGYACPDCGEFVSDYEIHRRQRAALSAPQAEQGERDAN